jgi:DNA-binding NtrC family response regulator
MSAGQDGSTRSLAHSRFGVEVVPIRVRVTAGPDAGRDKALPQGTCIVGTREDCDLVLTDPSVSRRHLSIELLGYGVKVTDLESKNGTRSFGVRLSSAELPPGCTLRLGKTELTLQPDLPPAELCELTEFHGLQGASVVMRRLFRRVERAAASDAPVLLCGETGTGKERLAFVLHGLSARSKGPFKILSCGGGDGQLFSNSLVGHVRGAFTGAIKDVPGMLEEAKGGTLVLDEVADLPLELQPSLLRVLETRTFRRLGDAEDRPSDFRLVVLTQQDLEAACEQGTFRRDLYFRLAGVVLAVPPLRARLEDVPLLAKSMAAELLGDSEALSPTLLSVLSSRSWPGNVRELRNTIERVKALGEEGLLSELNVQPPGDDSFFEARDVAKRAFERNYLEGLLKKHASVSAAARAAKLARSHFYKLLEEHGLRGRKRKA